MSHLSYIEAIVMGAVQGISELFPVSSLGHAVLIPALVGGTWAKDLSITAPNSSYLSFIVALHVATAAALIVFFRKDWGRICVGLYTSIRHRRIEGEFERLAWLLVLATIPVGIAGLLLDHLLRSALGTPALAAVFLAINGVVLLIGEQMRRRSLTKELPVEYRRSLSEEQRAQIDAHASAVRQPEAAIAHLSYGRSALVGSSQILSLLPGVSRSGIAMLGGMAVGLSHREAARFAFLLATPVILLAGLFKLPDLLAPSAHGILGPVAAGAVAAFVLALVSVAFLDRYFRTRSLTPFGLYSLIGGMASIVIFAAR
jgi:undecaprenyl-diphosphatase